VTTTAERAELLQVLQPDGEIGREDRLSVPFDLDDLDELTKLYRDMTIVRRIDTEAIALQRRGELGLWPSLLGQEAAQVGAGRALRPQDMAFPTYREHGVAWCRDVDPVDLLGLFRGTTLGGWDPTRNNFNVYTLVIGAQLPHAVGFAMGLVRDGSVGTGEPDRDRAVLAFLGDGSLSEGEANEAFIWAATQDLPVVFFCQNNQWAISAPYSVQSRVPVAQRADGFGIASVRVDGNDVLACLAATRTALDVARAGGGPTLIEAFTYRRNPHTTSDDASRYRPPAELDEWSALDPIDRLHTLLQRCNVPGDVEERIREDADEVAAHLRDGCDALPDPDPASPFDHTYASITPELARQRDEHLAFLSAPDDPAGTG
jgi:2-oxoisovalerate dehydrogenase E1 component alpha subunit